MKKMFTAMIVASSFIVVSQVQALVTTSRGFYQGDQSKEEIQVQVDGRQHYYYCPKKLCHPLLNDKVGYLIEISYKYDKTVRAPKTGTKNVIKTIKIISGEKNPELNEVRRAAEKGDIEAQNRLGTWYEKGTYGLSQDYKEAYNWYAYAAEQGYYKAIHNLGALLIEEKVTDVPKETALDLYLLMAQAGNALGFEDVGDYYNKFAKTPKEKEAMYAFYKVAAQAGRESAQKKLKALGFKEEPVTGQMPKCSGVMNRMTVHGRLVKRSAYMDYYRYVINDGKGNTVEVNLRGKFPELYNAHIGNIIRLDYAITQTGLNRYTATCDQEIRYINGSGSILPQ